MQYALAVIYAQFFCDKTPQELCLMLALTKWWVVVLVNLWLLCWVEEQPVAPSLLLWVFVCLFGF